MVGDCRLLTGVHQSGRVLAQPTRRVAPTGELKLCQNVVNMRFGRGNTDVQVAGNFLVGLPRRQELDNLDLPCS